MNAGRMIREAREAKQLSMEKLAVTAGVSLRTLQALETGLQCPHVTTLAAIADTLGLDEATRAKLLTVDAWKS